MWNDGWPKKGTVYEFYCKSYNKTKIIDCAELITDAELDQVD